MNAIITLSLLIIIFDALITPLIRASIILSSPTFHHFHYFATLMPLSIINIIARRHYYWLHYSTLRYYHAMPPMPFTPGPRFTLCREIF
jgi:hypothetical protein